MKKIIFLLMIALFTSCFSARKVKGISKDEASKWKELKFKKGRNVFWFDLDEENELYSISISGIKTEKYGKVTATPLVFVYNENLSEIIESTKTEETLLINTSGENKNARVQIIFSLGEVNGSCYIKIEKLEGKVKDTFLKQDKKSVQEFNANPDELIKE